MFQRLERLPIRLPEVEYGDANAAMTLRDLFSSKFGVMSLFNNYLYQSFNFRGKVKLKPFYDLVASISAEKFGHVELVATTINLLSKGSSINALPNLNPLENTLTSGNLVLDLLQNFSLECSARTQMMSVYEMTVHPVAKETIGYLLVRGGVHIVAFAKAIEMATGVDVLKMMPIPGLAHQEFNEVRKYEELGYGHILFTWNDVGDYTDITKIWKGQHPITGETLVVKEGMPDEDGMFPNFDNASEEIAPGISLEEFHAIAKRLLAKK